MPPPLPPPLLPQGASSLLFLYFVSLLPLVSESQAFPKKPSTLPSRFPFLFHCCSSTILITVAVLLYFSLSQFYYTFPINGQIYSNAQKAFSCIGISNITPPRQISPERLSFERLSNQIPSLPPQWPLPLLLDPALWWLSPASTCRG